MIPIQNIYYMLSYAFRILRKRGYRNVATEQFHNVADLCAEILIKGVSIQLKRGLGREYIEKTESLSLLRGRIEIAESLKESTKLQNKLICSYDDFSVNSYLNRIIKTTMVLLLRAKIDKERKKKLRKLLVFFGDVELLDVYTINWKIQYHRNNQTYRMLISICYLVLKGLLQTRSAGTTRLMDFFDDPLMWRLYETFIFEYFRQEFPRIKVNASNINWALDDDMSDMLPTMQSDITLIYKDKVLIIDAKYYRSITLQRYSDPKLRSSHLYQIFAYVKNMDAASSNIPHEVSGMLLYAGTDEEKQPDHTYLMSGNKISVKTLDLNCDFSEVAAQLNKIAEEHLGVVVQMDVTAAS
jgi:5-methylcytosine-specific restriction enzyme subunit McrC